MIVYKTTNILNNKIYVGKDEREDPNYIGSGVILHRAIKKYGKHNFKKEIIEHCDNLQQLNDREQFWIKSFNSTDKKIGYNITIGGDGGYTWGLLSEKKRKQHLQKFINAGKKHSNSPEGREFQSKLAKQLWQQPAHRKNIIDKLTGREIKWADKISKSVAENHRLHPRKTSDETKIKLSQAAKGKELKSVSENMEQQICELYKQNGPKTISKNLLLQHIHISPFVIIRILKKHLIYQKYQKGIG
jgi:hypothetical protein